MAQRHLDRTELSDGVLLPRQSTVRRFAVAITILYTTAILVLALVASNYLYDWSRLRILKSSSLSDIADVSAFIPITLQEPDADGEGAAVQALVSDSQASGHRPAQLPASVPAINVLLLGTVARPDDAEPPRTDTMILLSLDSRSETAGILSLPRDAMDTDSRFRLLDQDQYGLYDGERETTRWWSAR